jgi:membrane protease YdiL (CAAX protease family)
MLRARPVTSFLVLTFAVSYALGIPFNALTSSILDGSTLAGSYVPRIVTVVGPAAAALVVAAAGGGAISPARLRRALHLAAGDVPWLAAIAFVTLSSAAAAFVAAGLPLTAQFDLAMTRAPLLAGHVLIQATLIGAGEELGWRGWLLPTLVARHKLPLATALTGLAWAAWHLPVYLGAAKPLPFTVLLAALTVNFSWLWHRTRGRTALVAIAHGCVNAPFVFLEEWVRPLPGGGALATDAFAYLAAPYAVIAIALCIANGPAWRSR